MISDSKLWFELAMRGKFLTRAPEISNIGEESNVPPLQSNDE